MSDDPDVRQLYDKLHRCQSEIVILKAAVAALLGVTDVSEKSLDQMIATAAKRPVGYGDPESAPDTRELFVEVISRRSS